MKQKHADLIKAWADGAQIQRREIYCRYEYTSNINTVKEEWIDDLCPSWAWNIEYRFKPVKMDIYSYLVKYRDDEDWIECTCYGTPDHILGLTRDEETGKIKSVEIIK